MSNNNTAWNIYYRANEMPANRYVDELRKAVFRELNTGSCRLIEDLILTPLNAARRGYSPNVKIPMLSYHAIDHALKALENSGEFPELGIGIHTSKNFFPWDYLDSNDVEQFVYTLTFEQLQQLGNRYRSLCSDSGMSASKGDNYYRSVSSSDKKNEKILTKARKDAENILDKAKKEPTEITAKAEQDRRRTISDAEESAQRIREDARNRAANTQAKANTEADKTRRDAKYEADQIRLNAQDNAVRIKKAAEDDADDIRAAAQKQVEEEAERKVTMLIQQKLSIHIQELRRQWEEEQQEKASQRTDTSTLVAALKEEACTRSTTIGANLNQSLDQLQEQLNQLRSNMTLDLQMWRTSLYKCEYGKLVNFYNTLNGYANSFEKELREAECSDTASSELKTVLGEHSRKLNRLRSNLTSSMEAMGLRLFTPQKGDLFNSYYHTTNGEEDDDVFLDREIERCLKPGIERVVNDREVAVLLRSSVEVQTE